MNDKSQAVATIAPERLPYHHGIEQRFGIDRAGWRALVEAVYPNAKSAESVVLALSYCKARKLDPFKRVVHIVPMWNKAPRKEVETVWPGIGELRTTAFRTGLYAGCDPAEFGPDQTMIFSGRVKDGNDFKTEQVEVTFPTWCQITVYRMVAGQRVPIPGPRVYWLETYATKQRTEIPNDMWIKRTRGQIEKCAEAMALRKAFPEELGDQPSAEEMHGQSIVGAEPADVTPTLAPKRGDFAAPSEESQVIDPEVFEFTGTDGEVTICEHGADFQATFIEALSNTPTIDMADGLWETNSPSIAQAEADGADGEAIRAAYGAALARISGTPQTAEPQEADAEVVIEAVQPDWHILVPILGNGSDWQSWSGKFEVRWANADAAGKAALIGNNAYALKNFEIEAPKPFGKWSARLGLKVV